MQQEGNVVFLHEYTSFRVAIMAERKYGKKMSPKIDEESLTNFFQALRRVLWYYSNDEDFTVVGIEFVLNKQDNVLRVFLICNDKTQIEIRNPYLQSTVLQMFSGKLLKAGKLFIHWNEVTKFEEDLFNNDKKGKTK
jgi:hypothetical protein